MQHCDDNVCILCIKLSMLKRMLRRSIQLFMTLSNLIVALIIFYNASMSVHIH